MIARYCSLLVTIFLMTFCNQKLEKKNDLKLNGIQKFRVYDLVSLKGIDPIDKEDNTFPFVIIKEDSQTIVIEHRLSFSTTNKAEFNKVRNLLWRKVDLERGKMSLSNYEYHSNDSILILVYDNSEKNGLLTSIGVLKDNELVFTLFTPNNELYTKPGYENGLLVLNSTKEGVKKRMKFEKDGDSVLVKYSRQNITDSLLLYNEVIKMPIAGNKDLNSWLIYRWVMFDNTFMLFQEKIRHLQ